MDAVLGLELVRFCLQESGFSSNCLRDGALPHLPVVDGEEVLAGTEYWLADLKNLPRLSLFLFIVDNPKYECSIQLLRETGSCEVCFDASSPP